MGKEHSLKMTFLFSTIMAALLAGTSFSFLPFFASGNRASAAQIFTNASLNGNYAVFNIGRGGDSPQAGVSVTRYDGREHFPVSLFKIYPDLLSGKGFSPEHRSRETTR